jgi:Flp pilus assembly protein TadB
VDGYKKKAKTAEKKHKKKIELMEKRLTDQQGVMTKAAQKDKKAAFNSGILWGGGAVIATIVVIAAVVIVVRLTVPTTGQTTKDLHFRPAPLPLGQPLFATVR